jgi:4-hydroxybenzoyl-CoA thioesterase/acyl-CoA thioester hydrolase
MVPTSTLALLLALLPGRSARLTPPPAVGRASACAAALAPPAGKAAGHTLRVWIEDTDAYGIVYHANYLRFVERAAHVLLGRDACADAFTQQGAVLGLRRVEGLRYNSAAVLGDLLSVTLVPTRIDDENGTIQLHASITRVSDNTPVWSCASAVLAFTNTQAGRRVRWPLAKTEITGGFLTAELMAVPALPPPPPLSAAGEDPPAGSPLDIVLEADEMCAGGRLPLLGALRYFERQRSQAIGGANRLKQLYDQGTSVVVARMNYAALQPPDGKPAGSLFSPTICSHLTAVCSVKLRAKGTQVVFDQWLMGPPVGAGETGSRPVLARAEVTCLCIDPASRRIIPAPEDLLALLLAGANDR